MNRAERLVGNRFFSVAADAGARSALAFYETSAWKEWSYRELAAHARRVATRLTELGVRSGEAVGIIASRHPETIAAMIAILDIGAHYVPLDPLDPDMRLRQLCENAGIRQILSAAPAGNPDRFPLPVHLIGVVDAPAGGSLEPVYEEPRISGETPAYIMFTSGSTGEPKGVIVPHRAILRLIDKPNFMRLDTSRVFLHVSPMSFDASTLEIWGPLLNGGKCVLYPDRELPTAAGLEAAIEATGVNCMWLTASLFNSVVDQNARSLGGIEELLTGGEALSVPHVCKALRELKGTRLINGYGPTENTTFTTCFGIPASFPETEQRVPIGSPISGSDTVIVDDRLQPVPAGTEGELVALGEGLALGYSNKPELTRERFIEITGKDGRAVRGYRTGDRVVQRADGMIDYLGRFDDQVKIDGHRIEPAEIERVISALPAIRECRVLVATGPKGQKRLAAYVVATDSAGAHGLRNQLGEILPGYMVPHHFSFLDALPINANGKLDKAALPDPFERFVAPRPLAGQPAELAAVGEAWETILGRLPPSDEVNFFDAGGTSLEAMQLYELLCCRLARTLDPTFVFEHTTIRRQAEALRSLQRPSDPADARGQQRRDAIAHRTRGGRRP